jgi:hypothetical protein
MIASNGVGEQPNRSAGWASLVPRSGPCRRWLTPTTTNSRFGAVSTFPADILMTQVMQVLVVAVCPAPVI